jgi:hypothetical protein
MKQKKMGIDKTTEFLLYSSPVGEMRVEVFFHNENIWLTQKRMVVCVDKFLNFNEYQLLEGKGSMTRKEAEEKASREYDAFNKTLRIESDFDKVTKQLLEKTRCEQWQQNKEIW